MMSHIVMLVDDDPAVLSGLSRALNNEPYTVICAGSAEDALRALRVQPVDVVVSDEEMPGMHGTELLARIKDELPDAVRFMLTGRATLEVALEAINEGAVTRFFTKPCNHIELAVAIRNSLRQKDLMAEAMRLLRTVREQSEFLENLEHQMPGISKVKRDSSGVVVVDKEDMPEDFEAFLEEVREACDKAEQQIGGTRPAGPEG